MAIKKLILLLILWPCFMSAANWARTPANCFSGPTGGSAATLTCTTGSVTAGQLVVVEMFWLTGTVTLTDSLSSSWTCQAAQTNGTGLEISQACHTCSVGGSGADVLTMTSNAAFAFARMTVDMYTGNATSSCLDQHAQATDSSNNANVVSPNITTTVAGDLLWAGAVTSLGGSWTAGSGYHLNASDAGLASEDQGVSSGFAIGTYGATFTLGTASTWNIDILAFKPAPSIFIANPTIQAGGP